MAVRTPERTEGWAGGISKHRGMPPTPRRKTCMGESLAWPHGRTGAPERSLSGVQVINMNRGRDAGLHYSNPC